MKKLAILLFFISIALTIPCNARYFDPSIGRWLIPDPLADKYPSISPYVYCLNNPLVNIDPNGMENVVITGGEYDDEDRYKYNFVESSINQLKKYTSASDEKTTWLVANAGYSKADLKTMQAVADKLGVTLVMAGLAEGVTNYLNSQDVSVSKVSDTRLSDKVTDVSVFGHGVPGSAELAYAQSSQSKFSWSTDNALNLSSTAFDNANIDFFTCNAATSGSSPPLIRSVHASTNATVSGYIGRTTYEMMNQGETIGAKLNRQRNGFNTAGSRNIPIGSIGSLKLILRPLKR